MNGQKTIIQMCQILRFLKNYVPLSSIRSMTNCYEANPPSASETKWYQYVKILNSFCHLFRIWKQERKQPRELVVLILHSCRIIPVEAQPSKVLFWVWCLLTHRCRNYSTRHYTQLQSPHSGTLCTSVALFWLLQLSLGLSSESPCTVESFTWFCIILQFIFKQFNCPLCISKKVLIHE